MEQQKTTRRILTLKERENLTDEIRQKSAYRDALKDNDRSPGTMGPVNDLGGGREVNTTSLEAGIARQKRILADGTPEEMTRAERGSAEREMKQLKEELGELLLTHREMDLMPKDGYEYHRTVRKSSKQEVGNPLTQRKMHRYRELAARIDPDNPEAQSTEGLRKTK